MNDLGKEFVLEHSNIPMSHVDEVVAHSVDNYNPAQAHEYYLRTRKLKGRKAGSAKAPSGGRTSAKIVPHATRPVAKKSALQHRKEVQARVTAMKGRLEKLRKLLSVLTKEAKARSGEPTKDKKTKATAGSKSKKLTASERKEAAKRSAEYRKKHEAELKKETLTDQEKRLSEQIKDAEAKITEVRAKLKAAVSKGRSKSTTANPAAQSRRNT